MVSRKVLPLLMLIVVLATPAAALDSVGTLEETVPTRLPEAIPLIRESARSSEPFAVEKISAAVAVFGILGALIFLLQRNFVKRDGRNASLLVRLFAKKSNASPLDKVDLIASKMITVKHSVHVISWNGSKFLLGCDPNGMRILDKAICTDTKMSGPD